MSLGSIIRQARIDAGMSIDDLSERTSIRAGLLKEIESDDFTNCGGETYARGHLRNIAPHLKMDPNLLLELHESEQSQQPRRIQDMLAENNVTKNPLEKKTLSWKTLVGISLVTLMCLGAVQVIVSNSKTTQATNTADIPKDSATASAEPNQPQESPTSQASESVPAGTRENYSTGTGVAVSVSATRGKSWIFVSDSNGTTLFSGQIRNGEKVNFSATTRLSLKVGNAGAVDISVNGKQVDQIGVDGEVVSVSYGVAS
jgi:cytoskeletal protein RodZ